MENERILDTDNLQNNTTTKNQTINNTTEQQQEYMDNTKWASVHTSTNKKSGNEEETGVKTLIHTINDNRNQIVEQNINQNMNQSTVELNFSINPNPVTLVHYENTIEKKCSISINNQCSTEPIIPSLSPEGHRNNQTDIITNREKEDITEIEDTQTEINNEPEFNNLHANNVNPHNKNEYEGDMLTKKNIYSIRFLYQNVNSLRPKNMEKWKATIDVMEYMECDIVGMSETCVNWKLKKTKQKYENMLQKKFKNYSMTRTTTRQLYNRVYLPGGTATIITGKWNTKIESRI
jgi:hypothetical protein